MPDTDTAYDIDIQEAIETCLPPPEHINDEDMNEIFLNQRKKDDQRALAIEHFIEKNKGLIEKEAKKRFGENYNKKEVYAEAVVALGKACHKRNRKKRTKLTSLWWFYFQKTLDDLQSIKAYEAPMESAIATRENNDEDNYEEWQMDQASLDMEAQELLDGCPEHETSDGNYSISVNSFKIASEQNGKVPKRLITALAILTNGALYRKKIIAVTAMYKVETTEKLISAIKKDIDRLHAAGYTIYKAECLPNTPEKHINYLNNRKTSKDCIACAMNEPDAHMHLAEFGQILSCEPYIPFS
jgi:hypothetical protein